MSNEDILKYLAVLLTMPWWLPIARKMAFDVWRFADDEAEPEEVRYSAPVDHRSYGSFGFNAERGSERRMTNALWETGRRSVRRTPTGFDVRR